MRHLHGDTDGAAFVIEIPRKPGRVRFWRFLAFTIFAFGALLLAVALSDTELIFLSVLVPVIFVPLGYFCWCRAKLYSLSTTLSDESVVIRDRKGRSWEFDRSEVHAQELHRENSSAIMLRADNRTWIVPATLRNGASVADYFDTAGKIAAVKSVELDPFDVRYGPGPLIFAMWMLFFGLVTLGLLNIGAGRLLIYFVPFCIWFFATAGAWVRLAYEGIPEYGRYEDLFVRRTRLPLLGNGLRIVGPRAGIVVVDAEVHGVRLSDELRERVRAAGGVFVE